jgi:hypothetical protein
MMLVAARFTDREIANLVQQLQGIEPVDLIHLVESLRRRIDASNLLSDSPVGAQPQVPATVQEPMGDEIAEQIQRLLVSEAGLTKIAAAQTLTDALRRRHPKEVVVPYNTKDGFARWLRQLAMVYPLSEILHVAASVRNSRIHSRSDDWLDKR